MSILSDARVTAVDGGYCVVNDQVGPVAVLHDGGLWRAYFGDSTDTARRPRNSMWGSASSVLEETVEWALRTEEVNA